MKNIFAFLLTLTVLTGFTQNYNVTFRVDMSEVTAIDSVVCVVGDFQAAAGYSANWTPGETRMTDPDMDSIYEVVVYIPAGTYAYKFVNGSAWGMDEGIPSLCAVSLNRQVVISNDTVLEATCYGGCGPCSPIVVSYSLTFRVDMSQVGVIEDTVSVTGDFQYESGVLADWAPGLSVMTDPDLDQIYELSVTIPQGLYYYKFVNGVAWGQDEIIPGPCSVNSSREVYLMANTVLDAVCYAECNPCNGSGISTAENRLDFMFRNPVNDRLLLEMKTTLTGKKTIEIYNYNGGCTRRIETSDHSVEINVADLATGLYLVIVTDGNNIIGKRFVKE
jgi:hypothetical protein